mgnify:CR=1 FL=1
MKFIKYLITVLVSLILSINLAIAEKWDMALAYGAGNFHSANATEFAKNVTEKSGGKLTIVTHPGGSLFKGGEIFRAVRTGQAQIGERFMSALGKEDPLLEIDFTPPRGSASCHRAHHPRPILTDSQKQTTAHDGVAFNTSTPTELARNKNSL